MESKRRQIDMGESSFPKNETLAKVRGYTVKANQSILKVDTVELTTPYFEQPILGRLEDKSVFKLKEGESSPILIHSKSVY